MVMPKHAIVGRRPILHPPRRSPPPPAIENVRDGVTALRDFVVDVFELVLALVTVFFLFGRLAAWFFSKYRARKMAGKFEKKSFSSS